jgi:signal transduction histidine kinase
MHPPVLTDRGLDAALSGLAGLSPVPVTVRTDLTGRPPTAVEAIAYFIVAEALTNVAKHARASRAEVAVSRAGDLLTVVVGDDGVGGADPAGQGLSGLAARVAGVDGRLTVTSPGGGPTVIEAVLPCRSLSPRTPCCCAKGRAHALSLLQPPSGPARPSAPLTYHLSI